MAQYRTIPSALTEEQQYKLQQWLLTHRITLTKRTRREFSDVVLVAKMFKKIHNRLVDMLNYCTKSSIPLKLQNWEAFNFNVMRKMGLQISQPMLEALAAGDEGAIDPLFYELMKSQEYPGKYRSPSTLRSRSQPPAASVNKDPELIVVKEASEELGESAEALTLDVNVMVNGQTKETPRKVVFLKHYLKLERECHEKDKIISSMTQTVLNLETILRVKEDRINDLMDHLGRLSVGVLSKRHSVDEI